MECGEEMMKVVKGVLEKFVKVDVYMGCWDMVGVYMVWVGYGVC